MGTELYRSRLSRRPSPEVSTYVSSSLEDSWIVHDDLLGSMAHVILLKEVGVLEVGEAAKILETLQNLKVQIEENAVQITGEFDDVHEFIESHVIRQTGLSIGGKLQTGRSRNDQVSVDIRMRARSELNVFSHELVDLVRTLTDVASRNIDSVMPLYTHTQHAQVSTFGHYALGYAENLIRDLERVARCYDRVNQCPLGAGAVAGTQIPLDRERGAKLLGFQKLVRNSLDAVSSRDYAVETLAVLANLMTTLSRMAEDLIVWSSAEFGFVELPEEFSFSSSAMPQKKNPCTLELLRARAATVQSHLQRVLTISKGLSSGYNRDLQEIKPALMEGFGVSTSSVAILRGCLTGLKIHTRRMLDAAARSPALFTDLAEAIAQTFKVSFREAHKIVGKAIYKLSEQSSDVGDLTVEALEDAAVEIVGRRLGIGLDWLRSNVDPTKTVNLRKTIGSPSSSLILEDLNHLRNMVDEHSSLLKERMRKLEESANLLQTTVNSVIDQEKLSHEH